MKKLIAVVGLLLALAVPNLALAAIVNCPEHSYASCYSSGEIRTAADGGLLYLYRCTCGDTWWVRQ